MFGALGTIEDPYIRRHNPDQDVMRSAAMMTVAEWRKRAHDCLAASRLTSDRDGQLGWLALSDAWLKCAEWRDREKLGHNETPVAGPHSATAS